MLLRTISSLQTDERAMKEMLHESENMRFFSLRLPEGRVKQCGCTPPPEVIFQGVEGSGTIYLDDEPFQIAVGDLLLCPAGKHHRLAADRGSDFGVLVFYPLKQ